MKRVVKRVVTIVVLFFLFGAIGFEGARVYDQLPSDLYICQNQKQTLRFHLPATGNIVAVENSSDGKNVACFPNRNNDISGNGDRNLKGSKRVSLLSPVTFDASENATYKMSVELFGLLPIKEIHIHSIKPTEVFPVGDCVGIYVKTKGVMVVDGSEIMAEDGSVATPAKGLLFPGDYIYSVNGISLDEKNLFQAMVLESGGQPLLLGVNRKGKNIVISVEPKKNHEGVYQLGIWVKDSAQGIGTITYIDGNGCFGALGHGITDVDTGLMTEMESGSLFYSDIVAIQKGERGKPGELTGRIVYSRDYLIGKINANSECGIYGVCDTKLLENIKTKPLPIGFKQEIQKGEAVILCNLDGEVKPYDVDITQVHMNHDNVNRGIELQIKDDKLLQLTGGIVQGMSGSPIIQNGKLVGAVTHVFINDPTKGYGIFAENMLEMSGQMNE